jgi:hypothetical protein
MAVQDLVIAFNGIYVPTGVYSFEYRTGVGKRITEIFFMLPPKSVSWERPQRATLQPTLTGGYLSDYGNEFKTGSVSGECHYYYVGNPKKPAGSYGHNIVRAIVQEASGLLDGYTEYRKLLFMCSGYRDYTMTKDGVLIAPDFDGKELAAVNALKLHVQNMLVMGRGALADSIVTIWHDYDKDEHYLVKIGNFKSVESDDDPWTIKYTIDLEAYAIDTRSTEGTSLRGRHGLGGESNNKKESWKAIIDKWNKVIAQTHLESRPETREIESVSGATISVPNFTAGETLPPPSQVEVPGLNLEI